MNPAIIALIFGFLAIAAAWGIKRDLARGVARDEIYTFTADINPIGFTVLICGKGLVLVFAVLEVLHALGVVEDPMKPIQAAFGE